MSARFIGGSVGALSFAALLCFALVPITGCESTGTAGGTITISVPLVGSATLTFETSWDGKRNVACADTRNFPKGGWLWFFKGEDSTKKVGDVIEVPPGVITKWDVPEGADHFGLTDDLSKVPPCPPKTDLPPPDLPETGPVTGAPGGDSDAGGDVPPTETGYVIGRVPVVPNGERGFAYHAEANAVRSAPGDINKQGMDAVDAVLRLSRRVDPDPESLADVLHFATASASSFDPRLWSLTVMNEDQTVSDLRVSMGETVLADRSLGNVWSDSGTWGTSQQARVRIPTPLLALQATGALGNRDSVTFRVEYLLDGQPVSYEVVATLE